MPFIKRRPTTLPNYSRTRILGSIILAASGFICVAILISPRLSVRRDRNSQTSGPGPIRPIWELVAICFAVVVNGIELYQSRREPIALARSRMFVGWLITADVLGILFVATPAILDIPFGHMRVPLVLGLVILIILACGFQGLALSFVCKEESLRRAEVKADAEAALVHRIAEELQLQTKTTK